MYKIINIIFFLLFFIFFDFILTLLIFSKFNLIDSFYPKNPHRVSNDIYHHGFQSNIDTIDKWGSYKYNLKTNSLGLKDIDNYLAAYAYWQDAVEKLHHRSAAQPPPDIQKYR